MNRHDRVILVSNGITLRDAGLDRRYAGAVFEIVDVIEPGARYRGFSPDIPSGIIEIEADQIACKVEPEPEAAPRGEHMTRLDLHTLHLTILRAVRNGAEDHYGIATATGLEPHVVNSVINYPSGTLRDVPQLPEGLLSRTPPTNPLLIYSGSTYALTDYGYEVLSDVEQLTRITPTPTKEEWMRGCQEWISSVRRIIERHGPSVGYPRNFPVHSPKGYTLTLELMWPIVEAGYHETN